MGYRIVVTDRARYQLNRLSGAILDTLLDCLNEIQADPYRDPHLRVTLVVPLYRTYGDSYLCGNWAIAFQVRGDDILIEEIREYFDTT